MIAWFATNRVAANLLMGFAVLAGLASLGQIPVKLYPDIDVPLITVTVPYLGAAPEEVESGICTRVEERIEGINGIKELRSTALEGRCNVVVELFYDADQAQVLDEVDAQVNAIDTFPQEAEKPIIQLVTPSSVIMEIAVTGPCRRTRAQGTGAAGCATTFSGLTASLMPKSATRGHTKYPLKSPNSRCRATT